MQNIDIPTDIALQEVMGPLRIENERYFSFQIAPDARRPKLFQSGHDETYSVSNVACVLRRKIIHFSRSFLN